MWARAISDSFVRRWESAQPAARRRAPLSLRLRLILLVTGAMLPLMMLSVVAIYQSYQSSKAATAERVMQTTRGAMSSVERELENLIAALNVLALSPALARGDFESFRSEADRFSTQFVAGNLVGVAEASGQFMFVTTMPAGAALPHRNQRAALEAIFATGKPVVSDLFVGAVGRQTVFTIDVPVYVDGQVKYDLTVSPPRERFEQILKRLAVPQGWVVSIFDRSNHHIARIPAFGEPGQITTAAPSLVEEMAKSPEAIAPTSSLEGTPLLTAFTTSTEFGWKVAIGVPAESLARAPRSAFFVTMAASAALLAIALAFAIRLANQVLRAASDRELLINELNHRVKNTLTAVQAIVSRTLRMSADNPRGAIEGRLMALSHAHNILSSRSWESATIGEIVHAVLEPYADGRATARGPQLRLSPRAAIPLAMVINELATNAAKYGALAAPHGTVQLLWTVTGDRLRMEWRELGGAPVTPPTRRGYGTEFVQRAVTHELRGQVDVQYRPEGLTCTIEFPVGI